MQFKQDLDASAHGTSFHGDYFSCAPCDIIEAFGEGSTDGYKCSMEYMFSDELGNAYTLYDWKETSLYYGEGGAWPSAREFAQSAGAYSFHIGHKGLSKECINAFRNWLKEQVYAPNKSVEDTVNRDLQTCTGCMTAINEGDDIVPVGKAHYRKIDDSWRDPGFVEFTIIDVSYRHVACL